MRFMALIVTLASWLMISTFAFPQSGASFLLCWIVALLVSGISIASPGRLNLRLLISGLAFILFWSAILLPDVTFAARVSNGLVGALLFALGVIPSPLRREEAQVPGVAGDTSAPTATRTTGRTGPTRPTAGPNYGCGSFFFPVSSSYWPRCSSSSMAWLILPVSQTQFIGKIEGFRCAL